MLASEFGFSLSACQSRLVCWAVSFCVRTPPEPCQSWLGVGVWVCALVQVSAAPHHFWLGCWGVAVDVHPLPAPCHSWVGFVVCAFRVAWFVARSARFPGLRHPVALVAWHLSVCLGCCWPRGPLACLVALPGAPRFVQSSRPRCSCLLSPRCGAFYLLPPLTRGFGPRIYWAAARGTWRPAKDRLMVPAAGPCRGRGAGRRSASHLLGAPRWDYSCRVPPALVLGCMPCGCLP